MLPTSPTHTWERVARTRARAKGQRSVLIVRAVMRAAVKSGLDDDHVLRTAGLSPTSVAEAMSVLSLPTEDAFWRALGREARDAAFGLRAARCLDRGALNGVEYAMRTSATLGEALQTLERFARLLYRDRRFGVRQEPDGGVSVIYESPHVEPTGAMVADFALAAVVAICRDGARSAWSPRIVRLRHAPNVEPDRYRSFFDAPVLFEAEENAVVIDPEHLEIPMREADPVLRSVLERYLRTELEAIDPAQSLEDAVRAAIARALPEQNADLETIADRVGLSSRVLQKRLQLASTSFQELLDRVRESQAKRLLLQAHVSLAGTALELGYSDVTAFHRAFKRWTGLTPGEFRRRAGRESLEV